MTPFVVSVLDLDKSFIKKLEEGPAIKNKNTTRVRSFNQGIVITFNVDNNSSINLYNELLNI